MKKEDFAFIACRLLAIYWAVMAIYSISSLAISFVAWNDSVAEASSQMAAVINFSLVPSLLYILAALIFWFGAARIVRILIPTESEISGGSTINLFQAQSIAFSAVGIFLLAGALPEMGGVLYKFSLMKEMDSHAQMFFDTKANIVELLIRLLIGVLLLFGARGLSGVLIRIRELGTK